MRFGFCVPNNQGIEDPAELLELARLAEQLGYDSVWVSEHLFHASYVAERLGQRPYHEALTVLSIIAAATTRVRLGTSVLVLPWHHPARLAKTFATIDQLSKGRVTLGVGVGAAPDEYQALGVPYEARGSIADETLRALLELWSEGTPDFQGQRYGFRGLPFSPKPVQKPHPPVWIGGNSRAALRRVVSLGDGWHPLSLSPADLTPKTEHLRQALRDAGRPDDLRIAVRVVLEFLDTPHDRPPSGRRTCRGTPKEIAEIVQAYEAAGATDIILDTNTPDLQKSQTQMKRFLEEIPPQLP